jgi:hypothetical protein
MGLLYLYLGSDKSDMNLVAKYSNTLKPIFNELLGD